jgi:hypothetical protein
MSAGGSASFSHDIQMVDNGLLRMGAGGDLILTSDGTNGSIFANEGNLTLDVAGDIILDADGQDIRLKDAGTEWGRFTHTGHFGIQNPVSDADILFIGNDGGSTITALTLDMSAAGAATFNSTISMGNLLNITDGTTTGFLSTTSGLMQFGLSTNHSLVIYTNNTERMRIGPTGQITATSSVDDDYGLEIKNTSSTNPYGLQIELANGTSNTTQALIVAQSAGANKFIVWTNGDAQNVNNSYGALSDLKLKENIVDAASQWDDLKAVRVRKYSLKDANLDAPNMLGVIAQELEEAGMSGLVDEHPDKDDENNDLGTVTKSVSYSILYMKAIKALQEAMTRIETLEAKVQTLENN